MNTKSATPPVLKTLFPLEENLHMVNKLAASGFQIFIMHGFILFEGDVMTTNKMKKVLVGGVTA